MSEELEKRIGYSFKNKELLNQALTHKSFNEGAPDRQPHNEKLEFLGDAVIGLVITDYLFHRLGERQEGDLAKIKAHLVSSDVLFKVARTIDLGSHLLLGRGEEKNLGRDNKKIVSSCFEAVVGAVYLDASLKTAAGLVIRFFQEFLEQLVGQEIRINDYKSELQELIQKHRGALPAYRVLSETGKPPDITFRVGVFLDGVEIGSGQGKNRREAEQQAAMNALKNIGNFIRFEKLSEVFFLKNGQE